MSNTPSWMRDLRGRLSPAYQDQWRAKQIRQAKRRALAARRKNPPMSGLAKLEQPHKRTLGIGAPLRERRWYRIRNRLSQWLKRHLAA